MLTVYFRDISLFRNLRMPRTAATMLLQLQHLSRRWDDPRSGDTRKLAMKMMRTSRGWDDHRNELEPEQQALTTDTSSIHSAHSALRLLHRSFSWSSSLFWSVTQLMLSICMIIDFDTDCLEQPLRVYRYCRACRLSIKYFRSKLDGSSFD